MRNKKQNATIPKKGNYKRILIVLFCVLLLGVGVVTALELSNRINLFNKGIPENSTQSEFTKGETSPEPGSNNSGSDTGEDENAPQPSKNEGSPEPASGSVAPTAPEGNFVNTHTVSLRSSARMTSTCNTTPGATCSISFKKDGITKTLQAKEVDSGGAAYWNWTLSELGLTEGEWTIVAEARNGSSSVTSLDALNLKVGS